MRVIRLLAGILIAGAMPCLLGLQISCPPRATVRPPMLLKHHRRILALAQARGERDVMLVVASRVGRNAVVVQEVERLGGRVRFRADEVDYLRVRLPVPRVEELAEFASVERLDLDADGNRVNPPRPKGLATLHREQPSNAPPDLATPLRQPYRPSIDMDAEKFLARHPSFDGRGVGVAIADLMPDLLLPGFQDARALDGHVVPKVAEVLTAVDPRDDNDVKWVTMGTVARARSGQFVHRGTTYTTPGDGAFRFGIFNARALRWYEEIDRHVNLTSNPGGHNGLFAILWDESGNITWVDTNQNHSFADEKPMREYAARQDVGVIGSDVPETPRRESVGFIVQTDKATKSVRVSLGVGAHATGVAAVAVGNGINGGPISAMASEAQLVPVDQGFFTQHLIDGAILAARSSAVDAICLVPMFVAVDMNPVGDGHQVAGIVLDRLAAKYQKLILMPAGNFQGTNTVVDRASSRAVIAVGAYQSMESYRINYGAWVKNKDNLHWVGSSGPAGDGGLKPEILSPSGILSGYPGFLPPEHRKGVYKLPPGYIIAGGSSTAGPTATGAVALLVSAAKQTGVRYDAARLRTALLSSARFLPDVPAHQQGNGLVQVGAAWELLQALDQKFEPLDIESQAPVRTEVSEYLARPHEGRGIYEREGWRPGQRGAKTIRFTRHAGPGDAITVQLEWVGNDGTFSSPDRLTLPLGRVVTLPVTIEPTTAGVHSAILNLRRPKYPGIVYQLLNTVIAGEDFTPKNHYSVQHIARVERPGTLSFFVRVPPNTPALHIEVQIPDAKPTLLVRGLSPDRAYRDGERSDVLGATEHGWLNRVITSPVSGVWELLLSGDNFGANPDEMDSKPLSPVPVRLRAALVGVESSAPPGHLVTRPIIPHTAQEFAFTNRFSAARLEAASADIGSVRVSTGTIAEGERRVYDVEVAPGTTALRAGVGQVSDPGADVDLYVLEVVAGLAMLRAQANGKTSDEQVTVDHPSPGVWRIVVDAVKVPRGSTQYQHRDVLFHSRFGRVTVDDAPMLRGVGAQWTVTAHVAVGSAAPTAGRALVGFVPVIMAPEANKPTPSRPSLPANSAIFWSGEARPDALIPVGEVELRLPRALWEGSDADSASRRPYE